MSGGGATMQTGGDSTRSQSGTGGTSRAIGSESAGGTGPAIGSGTGSPSEETGNTVGAGETGGGRGRGGRPRT